VSSPPNLADVEEVLVPDGRSLKHVQVREYVRSLVTGSAPGSPAPSERELVHRFGVARMTVRQAMDALVVEGLLERIPGRGTFVARPRRTASRITSYTEEMARRGMLAESQTLLARREQAGPGVARALSLTEGDAVIHWRRLRRADGVPMCLEDAYLNEILLPGFLQSGMPTSLYDALEARGLRPSWAEDSINADRATPDEAQLLEVEPGAPVLRHSRRAIAGDKVVEVSRTVYRADRFTLWVQLGQDG
jgi:GntR family transcriptional regulator